MASRASLAPPIAVAKGGRSAASIPSSGERRGRTRLRSQAEGDAAQRALPCGRSLVLMRVCCRVCYIISYYFGIYNTTEICNVSCLLITKFSKRVQAGKAVHQHKVGLYFAVCVCIY